MSYSLAKKYTIYYFLVFLSFSFLTCKDQKKHKFTNALVKETSPYLLQHAHNPVDWHPWNEETLAKAKRENKLLLISIGYSSCHWCHVMEKESFQNEEVAKIMNENFINIKVDREERPDVDKIYISAVQLMTGNSGWPLNCIALPDGKPVWGATYLNKEQWTNSVQQVAQQYQENPNELYRYAENVTNGINDNSLFTSNKNNPFSKDTLSEIISTWKQSFDTIHGGYNFSDEKFPFANHFETLLRYYYHSKDKEVLSFVETSLKKMALGGIFDPIEGGFSRYSTDKTWHIPHFEKMLYDNGQLISLYSKAYQFSKNDLYKTTVLKSINFVTNNLMTSEGGFMSSMSAISLGEDSKKKDEGAYYVWSDKELKSIINSNDYKLFSKYYNLQNPSKELNNKYVLNKLTTDFEFAQQHSIPLSDIKEKVTKWNHQLLLAKKNRQLPNIDNKILTSWNAMMLKSLLDAYAAFDNEEFLDIALKNAEYISKNLITDDFKILRSNSKNNKIVTGYLEDYAWVISAYIKLFEITSDQKWLDLAHKITSSTIPLFYDSNSKFFYFSDNSQTSLITRNIDTEDSIFPSGNSIMAHNLFLLSHYFDNSEFEAMSKTMLQKIDLQINKYPVSSSNWIDLYMNYAYNFYEVAITGSKSNSVIRAFNKKYLPNKLFCSGKVASDLPLLQNRFVEDETMIYICVNKTCNLPTSDYNKALKQISSD